jgi:hypothetical protein
MDASTFEAGARNGARAAGTSPRTDEIRLGIGKREEGELGRRLCNRLQILLQHQAEATCLFCWKHSRQNTGRPWVGLKGTVVSLPHSEQVVRVSTLAKPLPGPEGAAPSTDTRFVLQALQRLGSFLNCLS